VRQGPLRIVEPSLSTGKQMSMNDPKPTYAAPESSYTIERPESTVADVCVQWWQAIAPMQLPRRVCRRYRGTPRAAYPFGCEHASMDCRADPQRLATFRTRDAARYKRMQVSRSDTNA